MLSHVLDIIPNFRKHTRNEPPWYCWLRAIVAICGLGGVISYFCILVVTYQRRATYFVTSQLNIYTDPTYNATFPIPPSFDVTIENFPNPNITCALESPKNGLRQPLCSSIFDIQYGGYAGINITTFQTWQPNIISLSDYSSCIFNKTRIKMPCPGDFALAISFNVDPNVTVDNMAQMRLAISETSKPYDFLERPNLSDDGPTVRPGEMLKVQLKYKIIYPVDGPMYYEYQKQAYTIPGLYQQSMMLIIQIETSNVDVLIEHYILSIGDIVGLVGGLYSVVASIFVILFGMEAINPWGIVPKYLPIVRKNLTPWLEQRLNDTMDTSGNLLAGDITDSGDVTDLRLRLRKLERVLAQFYLDKGLLNDINAPKPAVSSEET
ncbi:hypothetical protein BC936DRAFT_147886 [Jimgerdemannia flammicorona]|uniref:Uncharacterized protein n=1 Tax=Jimgerdemannia flammicorona TaxID=994334 RepID=A0A433D495_9FUNG|nr:hypothetical protein BC936DRAFT_147886 [Jimgerdemannia flammicorona]